MAFRYGETEEEEKFILKFFNDIRGMIWRSHQTIKSLMEWEIHCIEQRIKADEQKARDKNGEHKKPEA